MQRVATTAVQIWLASTILGPLAWWIAVEIGQWRRKRQHRLVFSSYRQRLDSLEMVRALRNRCQHPERYRVSASGTPIHNAPEPVTDPISDWLDGHR